MDNSPIPPEPQPQPLGPKQKPTDKDVARRIIMGAKKRDLYRTIQWASTVDEIKLIADALFRIDNEPSLGDEMIHIKRLEKVRRRLVFN
jgi:hypothetical protein